MYAARRRQKSVRGKFQFGKLRIGQQVQLFDNTFRQLPQGSFIGHQVALHEPQFVDETQPGTGVVEHHQHDHIADRQAVSMVIQRAGAVEFLVQLLQQVVPSSCGHFTKRAAL